MKKSKSWLRAIFELVLLAGLAAGLILALNALLGGQQSNPAGLEGRPYPPAEEVSSYPPPPDTIEAPDWTLVPTPVFVEIAPGEFAQITDTPWPTWTPFPSPTANPGPTPSPIPLLLPAQDATGTIIFLARFIGNAPESEFVLNALPVDANGVIKGEAVRFPLTSENTRLQTGIMYPSIDGSRLMLVGPWEASYIIEASTGKTEMLLFRGSIDRVFGWHPDSRRVLITNSGARLWLIDTNNESASTPLTVLRFGGIDSAAASPDGQWIVYAYDQGGDFSTQVWLVGTDGRDAWQLYDSPLRVNYLSWSPDGKKIAFFGDGWMVVDADGNNLRKLGNFPIAQCYLLPPLWSPDSQLLALVTSKKNSFCHGWSDQVFNNTNILLIDVESGESRPLLTDGSTGNIDPAWSPDGKQIAFVSNRSGAPEIWVVYVDGTNLRQLTDAGQYVRFPVWRRP